MDSLRYYEKLGILKPRRDTNGYRLYNLKDMYKLNVIRDLRRLDFSMQQIKDYLEGQTVDHTLALLRQEQTLVQAQIQGTRYEGAINLAGLSGLDFSNIAISQIQMRVTFGPAGGDSTKYLTFYKATKNSISGSIASMRGDSIGSITVTEAYNRTVTLTFNASSNAGLFNTFRDYFAAGNRVLLIYVPACPPVL